MRSVPLLVSWTVGSVKLESFGVSTALASSWVVGSAALATVTRLGVMSVAVKAKGWERMSAPLAGLGGASGLGLAQASGANTAATNREAAAAGRTERRTS